MPVLTNARNIKWGIARSARRPVGVAPMNADGCPPQHEACKAVRELAQPRIDAEVKNYLHDLLDLPIAGRSTVVV